MGCHGGGKQVAAIFIRECIVLVLAFGISLIASMFANAGRDIGALAAALLLPVGFCLVRAARVRYQRTELSTLRSVSHQIVLALAFISLLIFEAGVAMFAGDAGIPFGVWVVVGGFGVGYVLLFCFAHWIGQPPDVLTDEFLR